MASGASTSDGMRFLELRPVTGDGWDAEALLAAISSTTLPPGNNEATEKAALRRRGWRDPRGLFGYTKDCPYKDLYIYFDAADKSSPVNVAASKAFRCYGLDGKQHVMDWEVIRGPCVILRAEPPIISDMFGNVDKNDFVYVPLITPRELVDTLLFFRERDARDVALRRDAQRVYGNGFPAPPPGVPPGAVPYYMGPAGKRPMDKVLGKDKRTCNACSKPDTLACKLKACSLCKSAWYCDRDCQKKDFARHKKECASLAQAASKA